MLGNQNICVEIKDLFDIMDIFGYSYDETFKKNTISNEKVDAYYFFRMIGAKEVHALDYSDYEGADIIFDLNSKDIPKSLIERFDVVIDGGVLEHIFRPDIAIANIVMMTKPYGTVYNMVPCAGLVNHGFYSFSPTFFLDYYKMVGFDVESIRMQYKPERGLYKFVFYSMDCRLFLTQDGFNSYIQKYWDKGGEIMLQVIARKTKDVDIIYERVPLQGLYTKIYGYDDGDGIDVKKE